MDARGHDRARLPHAALDGPTEGHTLDDMADDPNPPGAAHQMLLRILRPVAKLMLAKGLRLADAVALMKRALVEAARETHTDQTALTDSRLSVLTGVHRKDLRALRKAVDPARPVKPVRNLPATVLGRWMAEGEFLDAAGRPRPLPLRDPAGGPSFERLATAVSTDVRPRAMLDELVRLGAASESVDGVVTLDVEALTPSGDEAELLGFVGANLGDHAEAVAHNLMTEPPAKFLERAVFYNKLHPDSVEALHQVARAQSADLLRALNSDALAAQTADAGREGADRRFRFGVYFVAVPEAEVTTTTEPKATDP